MMTWALRLKKANTLNNPPLPCNDNNHTPNHPTTTQQAKEKTKGKPTPITNRQQLALNFKKAAQQTTKKKTATKKKQKEETEEANKFKPSTLSYSGCHLLSKLEKFHWIEQQ